MISFVIAAVTLDTLEYTSGCIRMLQGGTSKDLNVNLIPHIPNLNPRRSWSPSSHFPDFLAPGFFSIIIRRMENPIRYTPQASICT
jgi:hypothetical protein